MAVAISMGGIVSLIMLLVGLVLTFVTIRRMVRGMICVPGWAKVLLIAGMLLLQLLLLLTILPPMEIDVEDAFINVETHIVTPIDPSESTAPAQ